MEIRSKLINFKRGILIMSLLFGAQLSFAQAPDAVQEAEDGIIVGSAFQDASHGYPGFSGSGYVGRFGTTDDLLTMNINVATAGNYKLIIRYACPFGQKTMLLDINGEGFGDVLLPLSASWEDKNAGSYDLKAGINTFKIKASWTFFIIDKVSLYKSVKHDYSAVVTTLINPKVNSDTKALYAYLRSTYSHKIISGNTDDKYTDIDTITHKQPMLRAWDFTTYTDEYPYAWDFTAGTHTKRWTDNGSTSAAIEWYNNTTNKKGIVSFQWHWASPLGGNAGTSTFYSHSANFDVRQAVITGTEENRLILRDIDSIASQLKKLELAGVPVLWRPLHEAGGAWFWWGQHGAAVCKQLYDIVYDRITNYHNINNLIWVWSTPEPEWYPGNDKVDIVGFDSYPGANNYTIQKAYFDQLYDIVEGQKMVAMTENGAMPDPQLCLTKDAPWLYFMAWSIVVQQDNSIQHIKDVYNCVDVLSLGDVSTLLEPKDLFKGESTKSPFVIYPNPAKESVQIDGPTFDRLELIDNSGQIVYSTTSYSSTLNISAFANGVFIVKLYANGVVYSQLLVVKR